MQFTVQYERIHTMIHLHFFVNAEMRGVLILTPDEFEKYRRATEKAPASTAYHFVKGKLAA